MKLSRLFSLFIIAFAIAAYSLPDASAQRSFEKGIRILSNGKPINVDIGHSVPTVADWNNDGKKDLVVGQFSKGRIRLYLNEGTDSKPVFNEFRNMRAADSEISLPAG